MPEGRCFLIEHGAQFYMLAHCSYQGYLNFRPSRAEAFLVQAAMWRPVAMGSNPATHGDGLEL
jgi:hypothetical protein